ncbi:MAG: glucose-6-phosphate isomerase, partial [Proteobacteria bacterium]|nr:glucose-6-phosphate isomerase [Pseudomonadota bacterium]
MELDDLFADYSKNRITDETLDLLFRLAEASKVSSAIDTLLDGGIVNVSEDRPALHTLLRCPPGGRSDKRIDDVQLELQKMESFVGRLHAGQVTGVDGSPINRVVNIGIGGSDLGPRLCVEALSSFRTGNIDVDFVSNLDPRDLHTVLSRANPATTMFIVVSKTFTTLETRTNAEAALLWLEQAGCKDARRQFIAVTTNGKGAAEFGIPEEQVFYFWDWVGGRYSLWSSVGLAIAVAIGMDNFRDLLAGAHE